jgi:hypothetical protein
MLIHSSVSFRKNITHLIGMAWQVKNIRRVLGSNKVFICLWLVMLLGLSSGRKIIDPKRKFPMRLSKLIELIVDLQFCIYVRCG